MKNYYVIKAVNDMRICLKMFLTNSSPLNKVIFIMLDYEK